MSKLTLAGIRRGNQFSPNHIGNDAGDLRLDSPAFTKIGMRCKRIYRIGSAATRPEGKGYL